MRATAIFCIVLLAAVMLSGANKPVRIDQGSAREGAKVFAKMRCDSCHSLAGAPAKTHPLPDLTSQPAEAVANLIVERTELAPEALFDEIAMSESASRLTHDELAHVVAYLRHK